ncbi:MAG: zinc-dependent alcohol dehydrogenase family protein [Saprospiraceae bacterium]|nr:zinc-dependent alcohol dehydrogenase family protein [Saprospiraceae bacterium]
MKALRYESFRGPIELVELDDPAPPPGGVVIEVEASGLCRSDWHGWQGHDPDIRLPQIPGHEFAGTIAAVGEGVNNWKAGDRVTTPFCLGCGRCAQCRRGQQQICDRYYQPGFTGPGCFARYVPLPHAHQNLVALPDEMPFEEAAILGCRFITAYRALIYRARLKAGEWVAIHACGGVGQSAIAIAVAAGARVIAVDISDAQLALAEKLGASHSLNPSTTPRIVEAILEISRGGVQVSMDALGSHTTCIQSIRCLRKQGRHLQVGLMAGPEANPPIPMSAVIAKELQIIGSHGMQAVHYDEIFQLYRQDQLPLKQLIGKSVTLERAATELMRMNEFSGAGLTIIDRF